MIVSQYIKVRLQYRGDFIIGSLGILFKNISGLFTFWILFKSISNIEGWSYDELVFIYAFSLLSITPKQIFFDNIWRLPQHLREGTFLKYYFKPLNMMFYYMSEVFDLKGLCQLLFGGISFAYASYKLGIHWSIFNITLLIFLLISSSLIMISIMIMASAVSFWVGDSTSLMSFTYRFNEFAKYPITIFNNFLGFIFTFILPISFIAYYPSMFFLRPNSLNFFVFLSPIVGVVFFLIAYLLWNRGAYRYSGTGS